jgi:hypothetical protein
MIIRHILLYLKWTINRLLRTLVWQCVFIYFPVELDFKARLNKATLFGCNARMPAVVAGGSGIFPARYRDARTQMRTVTVLDMLDTHPSVSRSTRRNTHYFHQNKRRRYTLSIRWVSSVLRQHRDTAASRLGLYISCCLEAQSPLRKGK